MSSLKIAGYILAGLGLIGFLGTFKFVQTLIKLPEITSQQNLILTGISAILIVVGLVIVSKLSKSSSKLPPEVPIYEGENIVGFRRHKKK